jgi:hypothetical protein
MGPALRILSAYTATSPETILQDWSSVIGIIKAAKASQDAGQQELARLLGISKERLHPLEDPFSTDFGLHRWLGGSREESYSDWLAWVMAQLDSAGEVFELFGLKFPPEAAHWKNTDAKRETGIPDGRLDIVLRWTGKALLVIEVKVTDEASASISKQNFYRKWIDKQREPRKRAVLLVVDGKPGESKGRFIRCAWSKVCLGLRRAASRHVSQNAVRSAMMLAFAGAVEQNLLDMPGRPLQLMKNGHLLNTGPVVDHLRKFHGRAMVKKNQKNQKHDLLVAGGEDFLKASAAIATFGNAIFGAAKPVLEAKAPTLKGAAGLILKTNKITRMPEEGYIPYDVDGTHTKIGLWAPLGFGNYFYLYVRWRINDEQQEERSVVARLECKNRASADALDRALQSAHGGSTLTREGRFFWCERLIEPPEFVNLKRHFDAVVDDWIKCAKAIGGLKTHLKP